MQGISCFQLFYNLKDHCLNSNLKDHCLNSHQSALRKSSLKIMIHLVKRGMLAAIKLVQGWTEGHNIISFIYGR